MAAGARKRRRARRPSTRSWRPPSPARRRSVRATALARALLALGGALTVLEDAGEPAHVRNDYRRAFWARRAEPLRPRLGVRALRRRDLRAHGPARRRDAGAAPHADGVHHGSRRRRAWPIGRSGGSSPKGRCPTTPSSTRGTTPAEVMVDARGSLPYAYPRLPRLELKMLGRRHYAYTRRQRRLLATSACRAAFASSWTTAVYADTARALLPGDRRLRRRADQPPVPRRDHASTPARPAPRGVGRRARGAAFARARSASSPRTRPACARRSRRSSRPRPAGA